MLKTKGYRGQEVTMGDCTLPMAYNSTKIEDRLCRLNYASWCPTCEKDSPRRRTRSETNEPCRRKHRSEMKTFTPKKYSRNTEYENMDLEYDQCSFRPECCRIRNNLCELPTTYISNNCQSTGNLLSNVSKSSEWSVDFFDRTQKPLDNIVRVLESPPAPMGDKKSPKADFKSISAKLDNFKSHYNVVPKQPTETRVSPPKNYYHCTTKTVEFPQVGSKLTSPPKLSVPQNGLAKYKSEVKTSASSPNAQASTYYTNYYEKTLEKYGKTGFSSPGREHRPYKIVEIKLNDEERPGMSYDTSTYFDRQYGSVNVRERYRQEIESLRKKLREMRNQSQVISKGPIIEQQYENCDDNLSTSCLKAEKPVPKSTKPVPVESPPSKVEEEATANELPLSPQALTKDAPEVPKTKHRVPSRSSSSRRSTDFSPLSSRRESKTAVKVNIRNKSKLSAVKMRKIRSKVPPVACSETSDSTESECSDSEKSDREEGDQDEDSDSSAEIKDAKEKKSIKNAASKSFSCLGSGDAKLPPPAWPIRESMFPHIPPYLSFNSHDAEVPFVLPNSAKRFFKWKLSTITPVVVRKTLSNTGFRLVRKSNEWMGTWGKHMKSPMFKTLKEMQKLNHFPGTFQIGRKDRLWRNLQRLMHKFGQKEFGFIPHTYILPQELKFLKQNWEHKNGAGDEKWIIKPPASARGMGIKVINKWSQLPKKMSLVVQQYISRPYLINGSKFDLRLYVLVTSFNPLRIYLWPDGLARFASAKYSEDSRSLKDRYMHLTNYSINKLSSQYTANEDANSCQGHKWTLSKLWEYMEGQGVDTKPLWKSLQDLVIKTILSGEPSITSLCRENMNTRYNCYELFGIDVLLDHRLKPWLLEVNISPSLHSASPLDCHVKGPLVKTLFDLAQFHIPTKVDKGANTPPTYNPKLYTTMLTKNERAKHAFFEQCENREEYLEEIVTELTADDVRHLTQAEDEFVAMGQFERIFPTEKSHSYLHFMESRYYNKLFDAWENRYSKNRIAGIARLQKLCGEKVHLKVAQPTTMNKSLLSMNLGELNLDSMKDGVPPLPSAVAPPPPQRPTSLVEDTILRQSSQNIRATVESI